MALKAFAAPIRYPPNTPWTVLCRPGVFQHTSARSSGSRQALWLLPYPMEATGRIKIDCAERIPLKPPHHLLHIGKYAPSAPTIYS